jgi:hypothetical protein
MRYFIITLLGFFTTSCVLQKNACDICIESHEDIIKSDTVFSIDTFVYNVTIPSKTLSHTIDCDSFFAVDTIFVKDGGLSLEITKAEDKKIRVKANQETRIITDTLYLENPLLINYHSDIAKYGKIIDSLNWVVEDLHQKLGHCKKRRSFSVFKTEKTQLWVFLGVLFGCLLLLYKTGSFHTN